MTFADIQTMIAGRLNLTSTDALTRIGTEINDRYKRITSSIGLAVTRRQTFQANATQGSNTIAFSGCEKLINVVDRSTSPYRILKEITMEEMEAREPAANSFVTYYAIQAMGASSVTIRMDCIAQSAFTLYADGYGNATTLSGTQVPAFAESFHDILVHGVLADEYRKIMQKSLAVDEENQYNTRLGELRLFIAESAYLDRYQGKAGTPLTATGVPGAGGGSSAVNGAASYTQTGLITFDRTGAAPGSRQPFAIAAGSDPIAGADALIGFADVTTGDVSSTKHGYAPKSPADATKFLNGAATPAYAQVKDSDLSTSDVVGNNVGSTKHGFAPKSPADATQFLNGAATPAYAAVKDSDLSTSDVVTNNVTTAKHGFVTKAPNDTEQYYRGDAAWAIGFAQVTQGRLTLTTAVPVTSADVTAATTLRFAPYGGNRIALYTTSNKWKLFSFAELSIAVPATTSQMYDVWVFDNSGTPALELLAWTNDTTRATALTTQDGVLVKTGDATRKYVGSFRTTTVSGQTEDSLAKRYVWNYYNRVRRACQAALETTDTWPYTVHTWRQANANTANQLDVVIGVAEVPIQVHLNASALNSVAASANFSVAIGEDSTSTPDAKSLIGNSTAGVKGLLTAALYKYPPVGRHTYVWLERSDATNVTTWHGDDGGNGAQSGIVGIIDG